VRSYVALAAVLVGLLIVPSVQAAALFKSANVTELGMLPEAVGAIGARLSPDGHTMYVTGATGLASTTSAGPRTRSARAACRCRTNLVASVMSYPQVEL
jgi:hypothetical protein